MVRDERFWTKTSLALLLGILVILVVPTLLMGAEPNRPPVLSSPQVVPYNLNERGQYRFSVNYSSPDHSLPSVIQVYMDGKPVTLTSRSKTGYEAKYTSAPMKLETGHHKYCFDCKDGRGLSCRSPRYGEWDGPYVARSWRRSYNSYPELTDGHVVQGEMGDIETYFTFSVHYSDYDSTPAKEIKVIIDGLPYSMKLLKGKRQNGAYVYNTYLDVPPHGYYFVAEDPQGAQVTYPAQGFLPGPAVCDIPNSSPELTDPKAEPLIGGLDQAYTWSVRYHDADRDPPAIIQAYVNGFPHNMTYWRGATYDGVYIYTSKLPPSDFHNYYFRAEDGRGGEAIEPLQAPIHGPVVVNQ